MKEISLFLMAVVCLSLKVEGKSSDNLYVISDCDTTVQVKNDSVKSESIPEQSVNSDEVIREVILPPEDEIYDFVEKSPSYPGGIPALKEYLKENLNFPEVTKRWDRVIFELVIDTDGSIIRKRYDNSAEPAVIEEIIRVIDAMPKWNPGKHKGKVVKARYVLPIFSDKKKYEN
jgi:protein TonB